MTGMTETGRVHLINFLRKLALTAIYFLAPLRFLGLGLSGAEIGLVVALFAAAPLVSSFPTGWLNDRWSIRTAAGAGLLALGAGLIILPLARTAWLLAPLYLVLGVANNVLDVSLNSLYYKGADGPDLNRKFGTYNFWIALGPAAGLYLGGFLSLAGGFGAVAAAFGALVGLSAVLVAGFKPEPLARVSWGEYGAGLRKRGTVLFSILLFVMATHWGVEGTVYAPFLRFRLGLGDLGLAAFIATAYLGLAATSLLVARIRYAPRVNKRLLIAGLALSGTGHLLMVRFGPGGALLFRTLHEAGDGLIGALSILYISRLFAKRSVGGSAGFILALQTAGQTAGALFFSSLGFRFGFQVPFQVSGVLLLAAAVFGFAAIPDDPGGGPP